jgi:hypothetical protein
MPLAHVPADVVVRGGRHLIHLTHPAEVNAFLAGRIAESVAPTRDGQPTSTAAAGPAGPSNSKITAVGE